MIFIVYLQPGTREKSSKNSTLFLFSLLKLFLKNKLLYHSFLQKFINFIFNKIIIFHLRRHII